MADVISVVCHHCDRSTPLTRPDINIRASSIPDTLGCTGLSPSQATAVDETVTATLADISELDLTISRLNAATTELERKRKALQCFIDGHKSLLNPVTRLPAEVLSQIFQQCIIVKWLEKGLHPYQPFDSTPLTIASVSRHWRNIALSTPRLWSALSLTLRPKDAKRHISLVSMWFSRSGNTPLSIHLQTYSNIRDIMRKLMKIFTSKFATWRHIHFKLPLPMIKSMSLSKSRLPMLETLKLDFWDRSDLSAPTDLFAQAPHLRDLVIGQCVTARSLTLPWSQLRNIKLFTYLNSPQRVLDILTLASNIERAQFRVTGYDEFSYTQAPGTVQLRNLQSLTTGVSGRNWSPTSFFTTLYMPSICNLSLTAGNFGESLRPLWTSFGSLTSLESLRFHCYNDTLDGESVVHIIQSLQHLVVLEVHARTAAFSSAYFLENFAQRSPHETPVLGPNLQTLLFRHSPGIDFDSFARALQSRCPPGSRVKLNTVIILCEESTMPSILRTFKASVWWDQIRDVGIDVQLNSLQSCTEWWGW